jgi:Uri superfamily endonuclease
MNEPGAYILLLRLDEEKEMRVGRLPAPPARTAELARAGTAVQGGQLSFPSGWYAYTGSAHGPGGLAARAARHLARAGRSKRIHWHVDYLREHATAVEVWARPGAGPQMECAWAAAMRALPGAQPGPRGFGASDCRCAGHLVRFSVRPGCDWLRNRAGVRLMALSEERLVELVTALTQGEDEAREATVQDLADLGAAAVPPLVALLQDSDRDARWWAARALAACGPAVDASAREALMVALDDPTPEVRACAALALGELRATGAVDGLAQRLGDEDALVASVAGAALARIGEAAIAALVEVLRGGGTARARILAVRALERIGAPSSAEALWEALAHDPNYLVHHHAYAALEAMGELEPIILST